MSSRDIGPSSTMEEILQTFPTAKVGLFLRYHIGGCASCGYEPAETLAEVCQKHGIADSLDAVLACIRQSAEVERRLHISSDEAARLVKRGENLRFLDVRSAEEWDVGHIPGAQRVTVELTFEALDSWPKDTPIVFYSNEGRRSLDKAAYFQAYGFTNARSLDGRMDAWLVARLIPQS